MPASLRSNLRRLPLRGPVHDRRAARRGRQLDAAYCRQLVRILSAPVGPARTASAALRQVLLIADCMWEQNDLVPELARIPDTRMLDLRPGLVEVCSYYCKRPAECLKTA